MFQNKQDCPLILDCENKSPTKNSNILLHGTSINAIGPMYLVSYRRKLTCTMTCVDLRGWSNTLLVYVVNFKRKKILDIWSMEQME